MPGEGEPKVSEDDDLPVQRRELERLRTQIEIKRAKKELQRLDQELHGLDVESETIGFHDRSRLVPRVALALGGIIGLALVLLILWQVSGKIEAETEAALSVTDATRARSQAQMQAATTADDARALAAQLSILQLAAAPSTPSDRLAMLDSLLRIMGSDIPAQAGNRLREIVETGGDALVNLATAAKTLREIFPGATAPGETVTPAVVPVTLHSKCCCAGSPSTKSGGDSPSIDD